MLMICDSTAKSTRRELFSIGSLAVGGLSLPIMLSARRSHAAEQSSNLLTGKSVIFLFLQGGPSQFETFDPKPEAPSGIRTVTDVISTAIPGLFFGDALPQLAALADRLAIIRSFQTRNAGHNLEPIVGSETRNAAIGAIYSRVAGSTHPTTAMPTNAVLLPQSVSDDVTKGDGRGDLLATGPFGGAYAPFVPGGTNQLLKNLRLSSSPDRLQDRRSLQAQLDRLADDLQTDAAYSALDRNQQQACEVLLSGSVADALDLSREPAEMIAKYDTARWLPRHEWKRAKRGERGYYAGHAKSLGKSLLLARRLCEAGCGFVTVHCGYEGVWDMHADGNNLNMHDGMQAVGSPFDHAFAALIRDLEDRGLADRVLVVATGEMGRTPRLNRNGGRDHWGNLAPLVLYGGGVTPGIVGQSTRDGGTPISDPLTSANLISTILHKVFDVARLRLEPSLATISQLAEAAPFCV